MLFLEEKQALVGRCSGFPGGKSQPPCRGRASVLRVPSHPQAHATQLGKSRGHPGVHGPSAQGCPSASPQATCVPSSCPHLHSSPQAILKTNNLSAAFF